LDDFDVGVLEIPEEMGIHNNESRACVPVFQKGNDSDVITRHDTIEDVVLAFHIWSVDGNVGKVNVRFV